jgi:MoxR-like ATPase
MGDVLELQRAAEDVYVDPLLQRWIVEVVRATRELPIVELGASVRGSLALERAIRGRALLDGRDYAVPEDVKELFGPVIGHRVLLAPAYLAGTRHLRREQVVSDLWERCLELAPRPAPVRP